MKFATTSQFVYSTAALILAGRRAYISTDGTPGTDRIEGLDRSKTGILDADHAGTVDRSKDYILDTDLLDGLDRSPDGVLDIGSRDCLISSSLLSY